MRIIILKNKAEAGAKTAELVIKAINKKNNLILGLATGKTMISFYRCLVRLAKKEKSSFDKVKTFNLDEYIGLNAKNKGSLRYYMDKYFFNKTNIKKENINFLNGRAENKRKECERYEAEIAKAGIDLQILGIGENGHIGFNEPGSSFNSRTREVILKINKRDPIIKPSKKAFTIGIGNIMEAKKIILLASEKRKADIVRRVLRGEITEEIPASILRKHKNVIFILDKNAAGKL